MRMNGRDFDNYMEWDISDRSKMLLNIFLVST